MPWYVHLHPLNKGPYKLYVQILESLHISPLVHVHSHLSLQTTLMWRSLSAAIDSRCQRRADDTLLFRGEWPQSQLIPLFFSSQYATSQGLATLFYKPCALVCLWCSSIWNTSMTCCMQMALPWDFQRNPSPLAHEDEFQEFCDRWKPLLLRGNKGMNKCILWQEVRLCVWGCISSEKVSV